MSTSFKDPEFSELLNQVRDLSDHYRQEESELNRRLQKLHSLQKLVEESNDELIDISRKIANALNDLSEKSQDVTLEFMNFALGTCDGLIGMDGNEDGGIHEFWSNSGC